MTARMPEQIYRDLVAVMGRTFPDRDLPAEVGPDTRVFADLGLASIELVVLGERLEQFYSQRLPFGSFLAALRNRGQMTWNSAALVSFCNNTSSSTPPPAQRALQTKLQHGPQKGAGN